MFHWLRRVSPALICLTLVAAVLAWTSSAPAATIIGAPVALSTLVDGGNIVVGDKTFTNFNYTFTGDMPSSVGVNVVPIQDDDGNYGIRFQAAFIDLPSSIGGSDALITYTVTAGANRLISDAHLAGNIDRLGTTGSASVTETFLPLGANGEFTMHIYNDEGHPTPKLTDGRVFTIPTKSLNVQKDILLIVPQAGASATISFVDQSFSQIDVPEPAVAMLLLGGVMGWSGVRRRQ